MGLYRYRCIGDELCDLSPTILQSLQRLLHLLRRGKCEVAGWLNSSCGPIVDLIPCQQCFRSGERAALTVSGGNTQPGHEIINNAPYSCLPVQRSPKCSNTAQKRHANDEYRVEPVYMKIPVARVQFGVRNV